MVLMMKGRQLHAYVTLIGAYSTIFLCNLCVGCMFVYTSVIILLLYVVGAVVVVVGKVGGSRPCCCV